MLIKNSKIGEKEYLNLLGKMLHKGEGFNWRDDCVITPLWDNINLLYSIDRPEPIFSTGNMIHDLRCFGRWSAALVANDVIACGAEPKGISFDIGIDEFDINDINIWIQGVLDVCERYNMEYEGGNLGIGKGVTGISWGIQTENKTLRRRGAFDGGILIATGIIGTGWSIKLWKELKGNNKRLGTFTHYQEEPWINLDAFKEVWSLGGILCSMDITDGIIEFGYEISEQNGLGVVFNPVVDEPQPLDFVFKELNIPRLATYFEAGYDTPFAHGWCVDPNFIDDIKKILRKHNVSFTILGRVTKKIKGVYVQANHSELRHLPRYWDDVFKPRGSIKRWKKEILSIFL